MCTFASNQKLKFMEVFNTCLLVACLIVGVVVLYVFIITYDDNQPIYEIRQTKNSVGQPRFDLYHVKSNTKFAQFETFEQAHEYFNKNCTL